jgi:hypothetical protein
MRRTLLKKLKKSQPIHINHFGENESDIITIFTTVREYPNILDEYSAHAVKLALEYLEKTFAIETSIKHNGVHIQVILVD